MIDLGRRKGRYGLYSRNIGAQAAFWEHILFLDDDNLWPTGFVGTMADVRETTGLIPYAGAIEAVGLKDSSWRRVTTTQFKAQMVDLGCLMYTKSIFRKYGYFLDSKETHTKFDWDLIRRIHEGEGKGAFSMADTKLIFSHKLH